MTRPAFVLQSATLTEECHLHAAGAVDSDPTRQLIDRLFAKCRERLELEGLEPAPYGELYLLATVPVRREEPGDSNGGGP